MSSICGKVRPRILQGRPWQSFRCRTLRFPPIQHTETSWVKHQTRFLWFHFWSVHLVESHSYCSARSSHIFPKKLGWLSYKNVLGNASSKFLFTKGLLTIGTCFPNEVSDTSHLGQFYSNENSFCLSFNRICMGFRFERMFWRQGSAKFLTITSESEFVRVFSSISESIQEKRAEGRKPSLWEQCS